MLFDVGALDFFYRRVRRRSVGGLNETAFNYSCHDLFLIDAPEIYNASASTIAAGCGGDIFIKTK
jgi:hypothetical protein